MAINFPSGDREDDDLPLTTFCGTRAEAIHRLRVGRFGLGAIVLMIGLANVVMERARQSDATSVPEASATVAADNVPAQNKDPLADAGVVPDLPQSTPSDAPTVNPEGDNDAPAAQP
jgi:hypothetical protein